MREVVIVSSWRRPQYLNQCLAALLRARGSMDKEVWVFQNDRPDANLAQVHERLSYYHNGIERRLTDVHGHVLNDVLA